MTDKDIDKLVSVFATKEDIRQMREDIADIRKIQRDILLSLDSIATTIAKLDLEYAAISVKLSRYERWFKQIAEKTGIKFVD